MPQKPWTEPSRWVICIIAALFIFHVFLQMLMLNSIGEILIRLFQLTPQQLTSLATCYFIANAIGLIPAGILVDRGSTKFYMLIGMGLLTLGACTLAFPISYGELAVGRILAGIGSAFSFTCCIKLASRWFVSEELGLATGTMNAMAMLGGIIAQSPTVYLINFIGFDAVMMIYAIFAVISLTLMAAIIQDKPSYNLDLPIHSAKPVSMFAAYKNPRNWAGALYAGLILQPMLMLGGLWGILYLNQTHHVEKINAANLTLLIFLGCMMANPLIGEISDKFRSRKYPMILCGFLALMVLTLLLLHPSPHQAMLMMIFFFLGIASSGQLLCYPFVTESNPPELTASASSMISLGIVGVSAIFQPIMVGVLQLHGILRLENNIPIFARDDYHRAFSLFIIGIIIAIVVLLPVREKKSIGIRTEVIT